jgi:NADH-quinone oxidoreductase subunit H
MPTLFFYIPFLILWMLIAVYVERKLAAYIQNRLGPVEVGYKGMLQSTADFIKLISKEIILPSAAHPILFFVAPIWIVISILACFCFLPIHPGWPGAPTQAGLVWILALITLKPIGILIAGWASNNKLARLGALRSASQFFSYEILLGLSILCVLVVCPRLDLPTLIAQQGLPIYAPSDMEISPSYLLGIKPLEITSIGGILQWNILRMPSLIAAYALFFVASLCISHTLPFDLATAESELVAGYYVEYSGLYWAWLMVAEYTNVLLMALLGTCLFLGGWNSPFSNLGPCQLAVYTNGFPRTVAGTAWGIFWLFNKAIGIVFLQLWIKWTLPRLRSDQLLYICWVYGIPIGLVTLLVTLWWQFIIL